MHVMMMKTFPTFESVIPAQDSVTAEVAARDPSSSSDQATRTRLQPGRRLLRRDVHNPRTGPPCYRTWRMVMGETQLLRNEHEPTIHLFPDEEWYRNHNREFPTDAVPSLHLTEDPIFPTIAMDRVLRWADVQEPKLVIVSYCKDADRHTSAWIANMVGSVLFADKDILIELRWELHGIKVHGQYSQWIETRTGSVWGTTPPAIAGVLAHWNEKGMHDVYSASFRDALAREAQREGGDAE